MPVINRFGRSLLALSLFISPALLAQQDFSQVQVVAHPVQGSVYYLEGSGGNIGLSIGEDGVVMIDDQFAPLTDKIMAAIRTLSDGEIRFLINTHIHGDHTGGNENFGRMGVMILARDEVRVRLAESAAPEALPVLTFSEDITINLNGEAMHVISVPPAHIDLANGGTLDGTLDALGVAIGMAGPNTRIIPGHGGVSTREDVRDFRDMILDVKSRVAALVAQGMNFDQVVAARPTASYDARWGDPARFLQGVYAGVGGQ